MYGLSYQVTKRLWEYIKANNLQKPDDKRVILCDEKLERLFKTPVCFTIMASFSFSVISFNPFMQYESQSIGMFKMAKAINKHLRVNDREVKDEDDDDEGEGEDSDDTDKASKKRKAAAAKRKPPAKKKKSTGEGGDKPKRSFPSEKISADLQVIVGKAAAPRNEVVKALWEYIKSNDLQDPTVCPFLLFHLHSTFFSS